MEILSINRFEVHVISPTIEVLKPPSTGSRHDPIGANQGSSLITERMLVLCSEKREERLHTLPVNVTLISE